MENAVWFIMMALCGAVFAGIGIFAWNRKKPMWFWSGSTVEESEIADIPAYNRANGRMWMAFSAPFWLSALLGGRHGTLALLLIVADCLIGLPVLMAVYKRIYNKYKA